MKTIKTTLVASVFLASAIQANATERAAGIAVTSAGLGLSYTQTTGWQFREGDQIQFRGVISGGDFDDMDDIQISGNDLSSVAILRARSLVSIGIPLRMSAFNRYLSLRVLPIAITH